MQIQASALLIGLARDWRAGTMLIFLLAMQAGCDKEAEISSVSGKTMGTYYKVSYALNQLDLKSVPTSDGDLQQAIESRLQAINQSMSTYIKDSEISVFNRMPAGQWMTVSDDFNAVLKLAGQVHENSAGVYDISLEPLVALWGFSVKQHNHPPSKAQVTAAMKDVGMANLRHQKGRIAKHRDGLKINLSSVAKGYAVDQIALLMQQYGVMNYLVNIGGEIRARGQKPNQRAWTVAVEYPSVAQKPPLYSLAMTDISIATSGVYRNFFTHQGVNYSHLINPQSGWPVANNTLSVTVLDNSCARADAYATALSILPHEKALSLANQLSLPVIILSRNASSTGEMQIETQMSVPMKLYSSALTSLH